jgi:hypothetical protein
MAIAFHNARASSTVREGRLTIDFGRPRPDMPLLLVDWRCLSCGRTGTAVAETTGVIERRVALSHEAKQPNLKRDRCIDPTFETTARYAE